MNVIVTDKKYITTRPVDNTLLVVEDCPSGNPSWRLPKGFYFAFKSQWINITSVIGSSSTISPSFVLTRTASGIAGYDLMVPLESYSAGLVQSNTETVSTSPVLLKEFVTSAGDLTGVILLHGFFSGHYETQKLSGGQDYITYFELYKRDGGGVETLIATSDNSTATSANTLVQQTAIALIGATVSFSSTDLLVTKIYAQLSGGNHDVTLFWDGNTDAHIDLPISPLSYVPENIANKTSTIAGNESSTILYPNVKGLVDWIKQGMTALLSYLSLTKITPIDADSLLLNDSADSDKLKLITFSNLWEWIKSKTDSRYRGTFYCKATAPNTTISATEVVMDVYAIPANTLYVYDVLNTMIGARIERSLGVPTIRIGISTSAQTIGNAPVSGTTVSTFAATATRSGYFKRDFKITGSTTLDLLIQDTAAFADNIISNNATVNTTATIDRTNIIYMYVSMQMGTAGDVGTLKDFSISRTKAT